MNYKKCIKCNIAYDLMHKNWYGKDNGNPLCYICGEENAMQLRAERWKKIKRSADDYRRMMIRKVVENKKDIIYKTAQIKKIDALPYFLSKARQ